MKYYWKTKTGEKIDIDEMTTEHLRNVLKMLIRVANKNDKPVFHATDEELNDSNIRDIDYYDL